MKIMINKLHYAILAVVALLVVYFASNYFREGNSCPDYEKFSPDKYPGMKWLLSDSSDCCVTHCQDDKDGPYGTMVEINNEYRCSSPHCYTAFQIGGAPTHFTCGTPGPKVCKPYWPDEWHNKQSGVTVWG